MSPRRTSRGKVQRLLTSVRPWALFGLIPAVVLLVCSVSSDEVAATGGDPLGMWRILPGGPVSGDWVSAEISSTAFLLLAIALARGKRLGFWLGLLAMAGAVVVQGGEAGHPIAAVSAVAIAGILVLTRRRYDVASSRRESILAVGLVGVGGLLLGLMTIDSVRSHQVLRDAADAVGSLFDMATPLPVPGLATIGLALLVARIGYLIAAVTVLDPAVDTRSPERIAAARRTLRELGAGPLRPYQDDRGCIPVADVLERSVLVVAVAGRTAVALGDPSGEPDAARRLLDDWTSAVRRRGLVPVIYQASDPVAATLRREGWKACSVGRDAVVDPVAFDLGSSRVANLRHTVTRARRGGLRTVVARDSLAGLDGPLARGLEELDASWRRDAGPSMGFTVGRFDRDDRRMALIVAAVDAEERPEAFVVLRPTGADGGWMLDLMRRRRDGTPGAVELCLAEAIGVLAGDGVRRLSLGLAPLAGLQVGSGPLPERALALGARAITPLYNVRGLEFFKQKFDPTWERRSLVVRHWWDLAGAVIALLRLHLGGSWPRVLRSVAGSARVLGQRAQPG